MLPHPTNAPPTTHSTTVPIVQRFPSWIFRPVITATASMFLFLGTPITFADQSTNRPTPAERKAASSPGDAPTKVAGQTLPEVVSQLSSDNRIVRLRALRTLRPFGDAAAPTLIQTLSHADPAMRYLAAEALGDVGDEARKPAITSLQSVVEKDDSSAVQMAAAYALCRAGIVDPYLDVLIERTSHKERGMVCSAAMLIGKLGKDARKAIEPLQNVYENHRPGSSGDYHKGGAAKNALRKLGAIQ